MSSVSGVGAGGAGAVGGDVLQSLMRIIYEAQASSAPGELGGFELGSLNRQQLDQLQKALLDTKETLTKQEAEAFRRGDKQEIKAALERVQKKRLDAEARQRDGEAISRQRSRDGVTQSHIQAPAAAERHDLPSEPTQTKAKRPEQGQVAEREARGGKAVASRSEVVSSLLLARAPVTDKNQLAELKRALMQAIAAGPNEAKKTGALGAQASVAGSFAPKGADARVLGKAVATPELRGGFPPVGRSGQAGSLPLTQLLPVELHEVCKRLGMRTLVDLLCRGMTPAGRIGLAHALGLPTTTLLLLTLRAELLDLPISAGRGSGPHLKDVLLLARLGLGSAAQLARLAVVFDRAPERQDLLGSLVALIQKGEPQWVGRGRITKHELKEWAQAALRRGSEVELLPKSEAWLLEAAADHTLAHVLGLVADPAKSDPQQTFDDVLVRVFLWLHQSGLRVPDELRKTLDRQASAAALGRIEELTALAPGGGADVAAELAAYEPYVVEDSEPSLLCELHPWARPADPRQDGLICFWLDPVPDHRHVLAAGETGAESLKAQYVCLDPLSGAVAPFGGGG